MDSDDEFMSDVTSQLDEDMDFIDTQDSDEDSLGEDFDADLGASFTDEKEVTKKSRKAYEVEFKVLSPDDIQREQTVQINEVSSILGLPPESAAILLRFGRWNRERLIESYMDHPEKILEEAGLGSNITGTPKTEVVDGFMCDICCEDGEDLQTFAMRCGHRFCVDCYRHYLVQKIKEEGEAARIQCPQDQCQQIVDSKSLELLVRDDIKESELEMVARPELRICRELLGKDARLVSNRLHSYVSRAVHIFCFSCTLKRSINSLPCAIVKMWLKKCKDDSETANWISANTKECPKCHSTIEKNGGCNHMTCRKCKHEFCWMCMGLWSEHGTSWYNCNRYEEKSGAEARDAQARSRRSLERYLHYYNRYANHEQSAKLDKDLYLKTEKKMVNLQTQSGMSWIEVQFLDTASRTLQECRQTLKWTYAFAFYLARNNLTEMFEDNQKDLELAVESLSEMFEKPVAELAEVKGDILDKTAYCDRRRCTLLSYTAENLKAGEWSFNVDITMA
ncbi:ankyrin repeat and IBR domain-containing protein 1 [Coccidioides immitis H538.4]|uniref:RBR-type E3 ubiquitin transferase n=1 Tax=Coccidioides immitis H538.4 TaxID=396776 RepID=A0A0J8UKL0_COCIT|nr:ankyrin repeat and IBR domain-containing protein 1 [Coccidioides immitis H538.4]